MPKNLMMQFGEILLISCYELGHQPIGLAFPAAFLERAGFFPDMIDLSIEHLQSAKIKTARFVGISVPMHTALRIGVDAAVHIRQVNPHCHICFFGLYASLNQEMLLKDVADSVIGGEYESSLVSLLESLSLEKYQPVDGVSVKGHLTQPMISHLPFPVPKRGNLPPLTRYALLIEGEKKRTVGYVEASRGCRHHCRHCPIPPVYNGRFVLIPRDVVMDDIKNLVEMGASHITFGDPDFLNGPVHALRITRQLHEMFPEITFDFTAKVEHLLQNQANLPEFASLGCIFIISAVESFSETTLLCLEKHHTRADAITAFHLAQKAGIALRPTFMPFTPWTSLEDTLDLFETIEQEGMIDYIDPVQFTIRLLIPPGSLLLEEPSLKPYLNVMDQKKISYQWNHQDPRVDQLQKDFSQAVQKGTELNQDPQTIFYQLKEYTLALLENREPMDIKDIVRSSRKRPPRLSEPWFCCAEPMEYQLSSIKETGPSC